MKLFSVGGLVSGLNLEEQVFVAKEAGFDGIEYIASTMDLFLAPRKIINLAQKNKICIRAIHIPLVLVLHAPRFLFGKLKKIVNYFPECNLLNFHLSGFLNPLGSHVRGLEDFRKTMADTGITVSCESNPDEYYIFKYFPKETYEPDLFANFCISHNLPINLDTSHVAAWNYNIVDFFKKYYKFINLIHLSDMTSDEQHLPLGKGILRLNDLFKEMKTVSYKGVVTFEVSKFPKGTSIESMLAELKDNILMLRGLTRLGRGLRKPGG